MTDELKPCLAYPCAGYMKENNYDASLECSSCQFIVADELEYSAIVAGRQAAIDAALEKAARLVEKRAEDRFDKYGTRESDTGACYYGGRCEDEFNGRDEEDEDIAVELRAMCGTNPLADLQQKNLELARHNMELRDRVTELERELAEARKGLRNCLLLTTKVPYRGEGWTDYVQRFCAEAGVTLSPLRDAAMRQEEE